MKKLLVFTLIPFLLSLMVTCFCGPDFVSDYNNNSAFRDAVDNDKDLAKEWANFADLPKGKNWVRTSPAILKLSKAATPAQKKGLKELYKTLKLPAIADRPGPPPFTMTKNIDGFGPVTIKYDEFGFPDFTSYMPPPKTDYKFNLSDATIADDFKAANRFLKEKFKDSPEKFQWDESSSWFEAENSEGVMVKYTWHHHQDGKTMIPVAQNVHSTAAQGITGFAHSGGEKIIDEGLVGVFASPIFD